MDCQPPPKDWTRVTTALRRSARAWISGLGCQPVVRDGPDIGYGHLLQGSAGSSQHDGNLTDVIGGIVVPGGDCLPLVNERLDDRSIYPNVQCRESIPIGAERQQFVADRHEGCIIRPRIGDGEYGGGVRIRM